MKAYSLKYVYESRIIGPNMSTTEYQIPVDEFDVTPSDYLIKDRIIKDDQQLLVFDTRQEYLDYLASNP
jgi:hypothetical protein